jgi:hypothetical protein
MNFFQFNKSNNKQITNEGNKIEQESSIQEFTNSVPQEQKNNRMLKQNIPSSYPEMKDKYHFFIGNFIKDHVQISILKELKKRLRSQYKIDSRNSYDNFFLCFKNIYIGYMTNKEADYYMNNILSYLSLI